MCVFVCVCVFFYYLILPSLEKGIVETAATRVEPSQAEESFAVPPVSPPLECLDSEMRLGLGRMTSAVQLEPSSL